MNTLFFTIKKVLRRTPILPIFLLLLVGIILFFSWNVYQSNQALQQQQTSATNHLKKLEKLLNKNNSTNQENLQLEIDRQKELIRSLKSAPEDYLQFFINHPSNAIVNEENIPFSIENGTTLLAKELLDKKIPPMQPFSYLTDDYLLEPLKKETQQEWRKMNPHFYEKSWYFLWFLVKSGIAICLLVLLMLLLFAPLSSENDQGNHLYWLQSEGISRLTVYYQIFFARFLVTLLFFTGLFLSIWSVTTLIHGTGSLDYPVMSFTKGDGVFQTISLSQYLWQSLGIYCGLILFLCAAAQWIETIIRHRLLALLAELVLVTVGYFSPYSARNPFSYLQINKVLTVGFPRNMVDGTANSINAPSSDFNGGIVVLSITSILLLTTGTLIWLARGKISQLFQKKASVQLK